MIGDLVPDLDLADGGCGVRSVRELAIASATQSPRLHQFGLHGLAIS